MRLSDVREIVPMMSLEGIESGGKTCRGLLNLRGEILPVFDLSGPDAPLAPSRFILVSRAGHDPIGLIADDVVDFLSVPEGQVVSRLVGDARTVLVARVGDELIPVIEPADVLRAG